MKKLFFVISTIILSASVFAQNSKLNPTVQVTNTYEAKLKEIEKHTLPTCVPDSIYHFDLNFDYSGFENPYKGTDEFNPFKTELDIAPRQLDFKKFYLKAGAGYTLAPFLDMAWTFNPQGKCKAGIYALHDSYFGQMYNFTPASGTYDNSIDGKTRLGTNLRWDLDKMYINFDAGYDGIFTRLGDNTGPTSFYNGGTAKFSVNSNKDPKVSKCNFGLNAEYAFGSRNYNENNFAAGGYLDFYSGKHGFGVDVDFNMTSASPKDDGNKALGSYSAYCVAARPRFSLSTERISLIVGVGLYYAKSPDGSVKLFESGPKYPVFPYLDFSWKAVPEHLDLYAVIDGQQSVWGQRENSLQSRFLIFDPEISVVKDLFLRAGARGNIAGKVQYDLRVGWQNLLNAPLYGINDNTDAAGFYPAILHKNVLENVYASLNVDAVFGPVMLGGDVKYTHYYDSYPEDVTVTIALPAWCAGAYLGYNYRKRIEAKVGAYYRSDYSFRDYTAASFVNLCAEFQYRFTPKVGLYLRGDNLLDGQCQYIPLFARKGICATAGVVLNF